MSALVEQLNFFSAGLDRGQDENLTLNALRADSPLSQALLGDAAPKDTVQPRNALIGKDIAQTDDRLKNLARMTSISRELTNESKRVEDLAEETAGHLDKLVNDLDTIHRNSLITILQAQMDRLEKAYKAPTLLYCCPHCLHNAARELQVDLESSLADMVDDEKQILQEGDSTRLSQTVEDFATTSRAAILRLEKLPEKNRTGNDTYLRRWRCGLCNNTYDLGQKEIVQTHIAKQELVLPLWDQLWMELSTERAGLLERKDKEQRDNVSAEHQEIVHTMDQFMAERREIKGRMEALADRTIRAVEVYSSLIRSFVEGGVLPGGSVTRESGALKRYQSEYLSRINQLEQDIGAVEGELVRERDDSLHRRKNILDFADEVKLRSQFLPAAKPVPGEIIFEDEGR